MTFVVLFNTGGERARKQGEDDKEEERNKQTEQGKLRTEEASANTESFYDLCCILPQPFR